MPSGAGLYHDGSDYESDNEDVRNALSPTDGYFNERPSQPLDVLVPDPSQSVSGASKEQEAREELEAHRAETSQAQAQAAQNARQHHVRQPSVHSSSASSSTGQPLALPAPSATEVTPLLPAAPPAYSPPSPDSPYHAHARSTSHGTGDNYSTMGRPEVFFADRDPEDMGGAEPLLGGERRRDDWRERWTRRMQENRNKIIKRTLLLLAVIAGVGFVVNIATGWKNHRRTPAEPIPVIPDPEKGAFPYTCPSGTTIDLEFAWNGIDSFEILQLGSDMPGRKDIPISVVQNFGELHIKPASVDAKNDVYVTLHAAASSEGVANKVSFERPDKKLGVYTPGWVPGYNAGSFPYPCIFMNIELWVKPAVRLSSLWVQSQNLNIHIHPDLVLNTPKLAVVTIASHIRTHPAANESSASSLTGPRDITIITGSGSIEGAFPLYDSLHLESQSGSITAALTPKAIDQSRPRPASLVVTTGSGSTKLYTPLLSGLSNNADIPPRDYQTTVSSLTGSTTASLLHGSSTTIKSLSGGVEAYLTPYGDPLRASHLKVETESASIDTTIHGSASHPEAALRRLYSNFSFQTGSLKVTHPQEWEGRVRGRMLTGTLSVYWPMLQVVKWEKEGKGGRTAEDGGDGAMMDGEWRVDDEGGGEDGEEVLNWGWKRFEGYKGKGEGG